MAATEDAAVLRVCDTKKIEQMRDKGLGESMKHANDDHEIQANRRTQSYHDVS